MDTDIEKIKKQVAQEQGNQAQKTDLSRSFSMNGMIHNTPRKYFIVIGAPIIALILIIVLGFTVIRLNSQSELLELQNEELTQLPTIPTSQGEVKGSLVINIPTLYQDSLTIQGNAVFEGEVTSPNIINSVTVGGGLASTGGQSPTISNTGVLSLAGQTGAVALVAGEGIAIDGLTISSTISQGNDQNIFSTIAAGGTSFSAGSTGDTLTFTAGNGITLSTDTTTKAITITSTTTSDLWTQSGNFIYLTDTTGNVGIGTTIPSEKLEIDGNILASGSLQIGGNGESFTDFTGNGLVNTSNALTISLLASEDSAGGISSRSGLEFAGADSDQLSLLQGCSDGQLLKWDETTGLWECSADVGGLSSAVVNVKEGDILLTNSADTLDFSATDFSLTESPSGEVNIVIDYTNSLITRSNQDEVITGNWQIDSPLQLNAQNSLRLADTDSSHYVALQAPGTLANNITYTLPEDAGTDNYVLTTDGLGVLSWQSVSGVGALSGSGTANTLPKFTGASSIGDSSITDDGTTVGITANTDVSGTFTSGTANAFQINAAGNIVSGTWNGTGIGAQYGGTGINTSASTGVPYIASGTWAVESSLDETRGGTGQTTYTTGDLLYASSANTLAKLPIGSTDEILIVSGGVPTWLSASGAGLTYWQRTAGTIAPLNISDDLLTGSNATASAFVRLPGLANEDGWFNTGGNFGIGNTTPTGAKLDVSGSINISNGNAYLINGTSVLNATTLGSNVTSSSLTSVGALSSGSIASGFGTITTANTITGSTINALSGALQTNSTVRIDNSGNLTNIGTTQFNGVTYTWPGADAASSGYVLTSNSAGTLSWQEASGIGGVGDITAVGNVTSGAAFTTGGSGSSLFFHNSGFEGEITSGTLTSNQTYTLPDSSGTFCLTSGNCAGTGAGIGGSGTANYIPKFSSQYVLTDSSIFDNGNIGIGTTDPDAKLHIAAGGIIINNSANSNPYIDFKESDILQANIYWDGLSNYLGINTLGTTTVINRDGGNVGIGTADPDQNLHVYESGANADIRVERASGAFADFFAGSNSFGLWGYGNNSLQVATNNTERLRITGDGNIGIGTTAPLAKLDIVGNASASGNLTFYGGARSIQATAMNVLTLGGSTTGNIVIDSGNSSITLNDATTLSSTLSVAGNTTFNGVTYSWPVSQAGGANYILANDGSGTLSWLNPGDLPNSNLWQQNNGALSPLDITDDVLLGATATASATVRLPGLTNQDALFNLGTGNIGIGITNPGSKLSVNGGLAVGSSYADNAAPSNGALFEGRVGIGTTSTTYGALQVAGDIAPNSNNLYSLGTNLIRWTNAYISSWINLGVSGNSAGIQYDTSNNYLLFSPDGANTPEVVFTDSGNVGIGVTNPTARLHVGYPSSSAPTMLLGRVSGNSSIKATTDNGGYLALDSAGTGTYLTLNNFVSDNVVLAMGGGNVGIGTSTPSTKLEINGTASISGKLTFRVTDPSIQILNNEDFSIQNSPLGDAGLTTRLLIDNDGNVGIGASTTNPYGKLSVSTAESAGIGTALTIRNSSSNDNTGAMINFNLSPTTTYQSAYIQGVRSNSPAATASYLSFGTHDGTTLEERFRISEVGNIGIGITNPVHKLSVAGTTNITGAVTFGDTLGISGATTLSSTLSVAGDTTFNGVTYSWPGSQAGGANYILANDGSGTLSWLDPGDLPNTNDWQRANGAIAPLNISDDLLLGSTATSSALIKFPGLTNQDAFFNLGTGNVGIGTTAPTYKLDVSGTGRFTGALTLSSELYIAGLTSSASTTEGTMYYDTDDDQLKVYANGKWQADRSTATIIVAAADTKNKEKADYVADGSGGTGDDITIQNAISALPSNGGTVVLLDGTYYIDDDVDINRSDVTLMGVGTGTKLLRNFDSGNGVISLGAYSNITVANLQIDGLKATYTYILAYGIYTSATSNSTIENVLIKDTKGSGINLGGSETVISNSIIQGSDDYGVKLDGSDNLLINSTIKSNLSGIRSAGNNTITNNIIETNTDYGIYSSGGDYTLISNNEIQSNGENGIFFAVDDYVSVTNNKILSNGTSGAYAGIYLYGSYNTITGNTISDNTDDGIVIFLGNNNISGNTISANGDNGISSDGNNDSNTIASNTVFSNSGNGIYLGSGDDYNNISGNNIASNAENGIVLFGANSNSIIGNRIHNNGSTGNWNGIFVDNNADNNTITNNYITDTAGTGYAIRIDGSTENNTYLADNTYSGTGASSILDSGTNTAYAGQLNSSNDLIFIPNGNIGIGTTTPVGLLNISGAPVGKALVNLNYTGTDQNIFTASSSGTTKFVIDQNGNVGIGSSNPGGLLSIASDKFLVNSDGNITKINNISYSWPGSQAGGNNYILANDGSGTLSWLNPGDLPNSNLWQQNSGALSPLDITDDVLLGATATASATVRLPGLSNQHAWFELGTGNLGVGTTAPSQKLEVDGTAQINGNLYLNSRLMSTNSLGAKFSVEADYNTVGYFSIQSDPFAASTPTLYLTNESAFGTCNLAADTVLLACSNSDTVPAAIFYQGNVGIGVTTPGYRLELPNIADASGRGRANSWSTYSSIRYKTNIDPIDDPLGKIEQLQGIFFNWKPENGGTRDMGFIAERVGQVIPEIVEWEEDGSGYAKALNYDRLTALLVEGVKAQQDQIRGLQTAIQNATLSSTGNITYQTASDSYIVLDDSGNVIDKNAVFKDATIANLKTGSIESHDIFATNLAATSGLFENINASFLTSDNITLNNTLAAGTITADEINIADFKVVSNNDLFTLTTGENASDSALFSVDIHGNATFSGQLTAHNILADTGDIETLTVKNLIVENISGLTASASAFFDLGNGIQADFAEFDFATINADLTVLGTTTLREAAITESLAIGAGELMITSNSINTLSDSLEIQSLAQQPVSIMAGAVTFNTDGTVKFRENVEFEKNVAVKGTLTTTEVNITQDEIIDLSSTEATSSASAGRTSIVAGETYRRINTPFAKSDSLITLTPEGSTGNQVLYIAEKGDGYFIAEIEESIAEEIVFTFFIVNTKRD